MSGFDEAVSAWANYFTADPDAAKAAHEKLFSGGQLGQSEQLGLSVALTPAAYRCSHYGDERYCAQCIGDEAQERREERKRDREEKTEVDQLQNRLVAASASIENQARALNQARRYIEALENELRKRRR